MRCVHGRNTCDECHLSLSLSVCLPSLNSTTWMSPEKAAVTFTSSRVTPCTETLPTSAGACVCARVCALVPSRAGAAQPTRVASTRERDTEPNTFLLPLPLLLLLLYARVCMHVCACACLCSRACVCAFRCVQRANGCARGGDRCSGGRDGSRPQTHGLRRQHQERPQEGRPAIACTVERKNTHARTRTHKHAHTRTYLLVCCVGTENGIAAERGVAANVL